MKMMMVVRTPATWHAPRKAVPQKCLQEDEGSGEETTSLTSLPPPTHTHILHPRPALTCRQPGAQQVNHRREENTYTPPKAKFYCPE